ncbi:MAG: hypothetical protein ACRCVJ_05160 [Clostridium sp.]|uniref:hypothetical protein n=1 Tax=Clostridium sp. TaxID=1506 RepID=UPI003F2E7620
MKRIFIPIRARIKPDEVREEIAKFESINKSPYSESYYNTDEIDWNYKPEGSLRISDHWNFMSHGEKHCMLDYTEEKVDNNWILAKYINGKYHVIKEFGESDLGYKFIEVTKDELEILKDLYNKGGIASSKEWYKKYKIRTNLIKETHIKNKKILSKKVSIEKIKKFRLENKGVKKIVYIEDDYMDVIKMATKIYDSLSLYEDITNTKEGTYKFINNNLESSEKVIILVFNNGMALDFKVV